MPPEPPEPHVTGHACNVTLCTFEHGTCKTCGHVLSRWSSFRMCNRTRQAHTQQNRRGLGRSYPYPPAHHHGTSCLAETCTMNGRRDQTCSMATPLARVRVPDLQVTEQLPHAPLHKRSSTAAPRVGKCKCQQECV